MKLDFYLSEMSVTDLHGGGLTLQRIIGDDLMHIDHFAHVSRMATDLPIIAKLKNRSIDLGSFWDGNKARAVLGNTFARSVSRMPFIVKKTAKNAARVLSGKFERDQAVKGLICPQGIISIYTLEVLKRYRPVKYVTWIMDDHLVKYINGEWCYPKGIEQVFNKHLREADHVFVISTVMQDFYYSRFGVKSTVLFGPADWVGKCDYPIINPGSMLKIGYFGAVTSWQLDALIHVSRALSSKNIQLHIYSGIKKLPEAIDMEGVQLKKYISPNQVLTTMKTYDGILLPMSFLEKERHMTAFNIATKMSEYLASGIPILAVGPEYAAMMKYLKLNNAAILVETCTGEAVEDDFKLFYNQQYITEILSNARNLAINETGILPMRKRWLDGVNKLIS